MEYHRFYESKQRNRGESTASCHRPDCPAFWECLPNRGAIDARKTSYVSPHQGIGKKIFPCDLPSFANREIRTARHSQALCFVALPFSTRAGESALQSLAPQKTRSSPSGASLGYGDRTKSTLCRAGVYAHAFPAQPSERMLLSSPRITEGSEHRVTGRIGTGFC